MNNTIEIVKQIVSIPSWVDRGTNESEIGTYIYNYLKDNSVLNIVKQKVQDKRFNIIASNNDKIDALVTGHIDTVQPSSGWTRNPTVPEIVGDQLYGLGSTDMKSGIAVMLSMATCSNLKKNAAFLFYCDEEYDFLGMKNFIAEYKNDISPKLIISLDGEGLKIGNSCRGLIEMKVKVKGVAGHSANPKSGINAITESFKVINKLKYLLNNYSSKELGDSTLNIANIKGGGYEGNIIADNCEYIVEIRVGNTILNADIVSEFVTVESQNIGLEIENITVRHNLGSWITPKEQLKQILKSAPIKNIANAKRSGYIDIQMLWEAFGKVPTFSFGAGEIGMAHKADEYVKISNIDKTEKFMKQILCE